jgi:SAM-dependent methyltransferase
VTAVFGEGYAATYDSVYRAKDYASECDLLERLFKRYSPRPVTAILDLGCGTGEHAVALAQRGYDLVGADKSLDMLRVAREKAQRSGLEVPFHEGDVRSLRLGKRFDATLLMFAVLGYQVENQDVLDALTTVRSHLDDDGLLIFDVWYGPAVLSMRPDVRFSETHASGVTILRKSSGTLDTFRHTCHVDIHVRELADNDVVREVREQHSVRFFFAQELNLFLTCAGFSLLRLGAFPEFDDDANETTWNVLGVAAASSKIA